MILVRQLRAKVNRYPGETCPVGLVTTELQWQLDAGAWARLKAAAGQTLTVTVMSAYLTENRITERPFMSTPRAFRVEC